MRRTKLLLAMATGIVCLCFGRSSGAEIIPIPSPGTDGDTWSHVPFSGLTLTEVPPMRFQQVYNATAFSALGEAVGLITGVRFVSDINVGRAWTADLPHVEISLSVTPRSADELSPVFADNLGTSVTVHNGRLLLSSDGRGTFAGIDFQTPFAYNPDEGNLLLEIKNYEPTRFPGVPQANAGPLDAWNVVGDPVSRVFAIGNANATVGTADSLGLTTFFAVTPIPEPSTTVLLALGLCALAWTWAKHRKP